MPAATRFNQNSHYTLYTTVLTPFGLVDGLIEFLQVVLEAKHVEGYVVVEVLVRLHLEALVLLVQLVLLKNVVRETLKRLRGCYMSMYTG